MLKNLVISLSVFLLLLGSTEVALQVYQRVVRNRDIDDIRFHPLYRDFYFTGRSFKPSSGGAWQSIPEMKINRYGFSGNDFTIEKLPDSFRILTIGASTTHSGNYPDKLADLLEGNTPGKIEIINAAVPSWNSTQSLIQFMLRGAYLNSDVVLVYHSINDSWTKKHHWFEEIKEVDYRKYGGFFSQHSVLYNYIAKQIVTIRQRLENAGLIAITSVDLHSASANYSTEVFSTNIKNIVRTARAQGSTVALITMPLNFDPDDTPERALSRAGFSYSDYRFAVARVKDNNEVLRAIAASHEGVLLIDAADSALQGDADAFVDLCHFNDAGAQRFAELIASSIQQHIPVARSSERDL